MPKKFLSSKTKFDSFEGRLTLLGYNHKLLAKSQSWKMKLSLIISFSLDNLLLNWLKKHNIPRCFERSKEISALVQKGIFCSWKELNFMGEHEQIKLYLLLVCMANISQSFLCYSSFHCHLQHLLAHWWR